MTGGRVDIDPADPRGFYAALGVAPTASPAEIKSAFRRRAKDLHPDRNPDPGAREAFHRLTAAYEVLSDTVRRTAYDSRRTAGRGGTSGAGASGQAGGADRQHSRHTASPGSRSGAAPRQPRDGDPTRAYRQTQARTQPRPGPQRPGPGPGPARSAAPPLSCCCCGKVAAQPRVVEFITVTGTLFRSREQVQDGVYCRACADRTALKVAARCWLTGWWSLTGPLKTLRALGIALRGGRLPRQQNHRLLMQQARAFLAQHDPMMAHAVALQAQMFAPDGVSRLHTDQLLAQIRAAAPGQTLPPLKDRWRGASPLQLLQLLPVYGLVVLLALLFWPGSQTTEPAAADPAPTAPGGTAAGGTTAGGIGLAGTGPGAIPVKPGGPMAVPPSPATPSPLPAPSPAPPPPPPPIVSLSAGGVRAGQYHDIRVAATALRTGPGQEFQTLLLLGAGETVMVSEVATDGQWARVQTLTGRTGFISSRALTLTDPDRAEALRREQKRSGRP